MAFELTIVTPEGEVYSDRAHGVVLPGSEGDFGVLEGHERFLAPLRTGEVEIRKGEVLQYAAISGGFADVSESRVVVLADTCELAEQIDVARAEQARARAEQEIERLQAANAENHEFRLRRAALERAVVRIRIGGRAG
jgi:F-type H+-transporting ATPase subunit epsilon